jgi:cell division septum initiation protein DivIVA
VSVGYRAILRLDDSNSAIRIAEAELHKWLSSKLPRSSSARLALSDVTAEGHHVLGSRLEVTVSRQVDESSGSRLQLIRLRETNDEGVWVVSLFALEQPMASTHRQTLVIDVDSVGTSEDDAIEKVRPPRLVRQLLANAEVRDSRTRLYARPKVADIDDVPEVYRAIMDPARTASVIVAPSLGADAMRAWSDVLTSLTKDSAGVATAFILTPEALDRISPLLPDSHAVERGNIRTFAPAVDLTSAADGRRHRYLGATTLARSLSGLRVHENLQIQHGREARRRFLDLTLPEDVESGLRALAREEARVVRGARVSRQLRTEATARKPLVELLPPNPPRVLEPRAPSVPDRQPLAPEAEAVLPPETDNLPTDKRSERPSTAPAVSALLHRLTSMVGRWLKKSRFEIDQLDELDDYIATQEAYQNAAFEDNEALQARAEQLERELKEARAAHDSMEFELAFAEEDARTAYRDAQILRRQLVDLHEIERAYAVEIEDAEVWGSPPDMSELLERLDPTAGTEPHPVTRHIIFSGNVAAALRVGRHDGFGRHASSMWLFIRILNDYAEFKKAGTFTGNVHQYLTDDRAPQGTKCSAERHAGTESELVLDNPRLRAERILPAPTSSDPGRVQLMAAHFKPTTNDGYAPRMHYFDDLDENGFIYIGYVGEHLSLPKKH